MCDQDAYSMAQFDLSFREVHLPEGVVKLNKI